MFYKKKEFPEEGELVICTVKRILPHCAFVILDEYESKEGMLHISEISTKWVKNIKDHINEGKKIVCKVLSVDKEKNYIDVSLKRVTPAELKMKMNQWKFENRVEKMLEIIGKKFNMNLDQVYEEIGDQLIQKYGNLGLLIEDVKNKGYAAFDDIKIPDEWKKELYRLIEESIKTSMVTIKGSLSVKCMEGDGVERIKKLFESMKEIAKKDGSEISFLYAGSGKYLYSIKAKTYKEGENKRTKIFEEADKIAKQNKIEFSIK